MLVTKPSPDFKAQAVMADNTFKEVSNKLIRVQEETLG